MTWPDTEDGNVFTLLEQRGFDFSMERIIDFEIDFDHWPLTSEEKDKISGLYPNSEFFDPDEEDIEEGITLGYVQCHFNSILTYEFVIETQERISNEVKSMGGFCDSWGVLF